MCRKAHNNKEVVSLRNAWWVTQKALTHPTLRLKQVPFVYAVKMEFMNEFRSETSLNAGG
jgi:hypothetical protein